MRLDHFMSQNHPMHHLIPDGVTSGITYSLSSKRTPRPQPAQPPFRLAKTETAGQ